MALKHSMLHWVLKYYQDHSEDDIGLTLTFLYRKAKCEKNANTYDFMESFDGFGLKIGNKCCLNEYMKIYEYKKSSSFLDLFPRSLIV